MSNSNLKYIQYFPDGSGRDGYINLNSGGFSKFMPKVLITPHYEILKSNREPYQFRDLSKTSWSVKYKSDGSGRDSYILANSGGLQHDYRPNKAFGSILRAGFADSMRPNTSSNFSVLDNRLKTEGAKNSNDNQQSMNNKILKFRFIGRDEFILSNKLRKIQTEVTNRLYSSHNNRKEITKEKEELPKELYKTKVLNRKLMNTNKFNLVTIPDEMLSDTKINDKITNRKFSLKTYQELRKLRNLSDHINSNKSGQFSKKNIIDSMKEINNNNDFNKGSQTNCVLETLENKNLSSNNYKREVNTKFKIGDNVNKMINELDLYNKQSVKNLTKTKFIFPQLTK